MAQAQLQSAPVPVLVGGAFLALIIAAVALKLRQVPGRERAMHFLAGSMVGGLGGFLIYLLDPVPFDGFLLYVVLNAVAGGLVGVQIGENGIRSWRHYWRER